jgi:DNA-binding FadR family transcriptional regulator
MNARGVEVLRSLLDLLTRGDLKPGEPFPFCAEIAETFGVDDTLVHDVLSTLEERRVVRATGEGLTVTAPAQEWDIGDGEVVAAVLRAPPGNEYLDTIRDLFPLVFACGAPQIPKQFAKALQHQTPSALATKASKRCRGTN